MNVLLAHDTVRKQAENERERGALAHEARVLAAVAHPGVVRLIDAVEEPPGTLVLERAAGSLTDLDAQAPEEVAAWGAAAFTTLADLHDLGWVHCGLAEEHILFDEGGRPLLCSFSRARQLACDGRSAMRVVQADVAAMARIVRSRIPPDERRIRALLARAGGKVSGAGRLWWLGTPGARELAEALAARARARPTGGRGRQATPRAALVLCGLSAAAAGTWWIVADQQQRGTKPAPEERNQVLLTAAGERYALRSPAGQHDLALAGRWDCGGVKVAVLDTRSGWLWLFSKMPPPGGTATGLPVARFRDATAMRSVPGGHCGRLEILRAGESPVDPLGTGGR